MCSLHCPPLSQRFMLFQVVFMKSGTAEAHIIKKQFSALMADEVDKFATLIQTMAV
jgi:hypothetical protein